MTEKEGTTQKDFAYQSGSQAVKSSRESHCESSQRRGSTCISWEECHVLRMRPRLSSVSSRGGTKRKSRLDRRAMVSINHRDKKEWVVADFCSFRASAAFPEKLNTLEMICTNVTQKQKETA
ncbi:MAG: hypothetical protein LUI14_02150 [Lachnospiraceae bacterium]|nr:hypothetical protein [Lachnospiraceae bacterium]